MTDVSYRPGEWFGLVSEHGVALLPDQLDDTQLTTVWRAFDTGGGLTTVLDALASTHGPRLDSIPPFALVTLEGDRLRVAVRGDLVVDVTTRVDDAEVVSSISGESVTTWVERALDAPLSMSVGAKQAEPTSSRSLPIMRGVVRVSSVTATYCDGAVGAPVGDAAGAVTLVASTEAHTTHEPRAWDLGETQVPELDQTVGATAAWPSPPDDSDHDGATISVAQLRAMQAAPDRAAPDRAAPELTTRGRIEVSTGEIVPLDHPIIIGRRPEALRVSPNEVPHLIRVPSPEQDISRSHLEIRVEGQNVVVRDLATTNGSILHRPGSSPLKLQAETATLVVSHDVIDIGDGVTVTFLDLP